jgi:multimeric flavodoxin WrbA
MKIVAVLGSPRPKSNGSALARIVMDTAAQMGAETSEFVLNKLAFKGCQACESCKQKLDHCVLKDELTPVLEAVKQADAVILATPNYFGEVSGQFKSFFDRTYSYLTPERTSRLQPGKSSVFVLAQGQPDLSLYTDVCARYDAWLERHGFAKRLLLRMNGPRAADSLGERSDLVAQAEQIGRDLMA